MKRILFVCHGNICRSPMAEFVMRDIIEKQGLQNKFEIASAATSTEEIGNPVYPPVKKLLEKNGISCIGKTSRQLKKEDYEKYDFIIGMDNANFRNIKRICGNDTQNKVYLLMDFTNNKKEVADPWYTRNFELTWNDVNEGCNGLLEYLKKECDF